MVLSCGSSVSAFQYKDVSRGAIPTTSRRFFIDAHRHCLRHFTALRMQAEFARQHAASKTVPL
jgi:hypothetical protein